MVISGNFYTQNLDVHETFKNIYSKEYIATLKQRNMTRPFHQYLVLKVSFMIWGHICEVDRSSVTPIGRLPPTFLSLPVNWQEVNKNLIQITKVYLKFLSRRYQPEGQSPQHAPRFCR